MADLSVPEDLNYRDLTRRQRLLVVYALGLSTLILVYTVAYYWGMRTLEDQPRSIFQALNTVIETMTTVVPTRASRYEPFRLCPSRAPVRRLAATGAGSTPKNELGEA